MLTDDATVAAWHNQGLPNDRMSTENAAILTTSERWPLIIDPQQQGIKWIRNWLGSELRVVQLGQGGWDGLSFICLLSPCPIWILLELLIYHEMGMSKYIFYVFFFFHSVPFFPQQVSRCDWASRCLWRNSSDRKSARKVRPSPGASIGQKHYQKRKVGSETATLNWHGCFKKYAYEASNRLTNS